MAAQGELARLRAYADGFTDLADRLETFRRRRAASDTESMRRLIVDCRVWGLLGPNGAGKSTLLGFCAAVTLPTSGRVHVLGEQASQGERGRTLTARALIADPRLLLLDDTHPDVASVLVAHRLEELPATTPMRC